MWRRHCLQYHRLAINNSCSWWSHKQGQPTEPQCSIYSVHTHTRVYWLSSIKSSTIICIVFSLSNVHSHTHTHSHFKSDNGVWAVIQSVSIFILPAQTRRPLDCELFVIHVVRLPWGCHILMRWCHSNTLLIAQARMSYSRCVYCVLKWTVKV